MKIPVNKYQTEITDEIWDELPKEIQESLIDYTTNVEYIKRYIAPNRKYARDLKRDSNNRIIVDICNPHILEDMEYFRPTGNYYKKYGVVTKLRPNPNPNSEFSKWINTELDRIWNGMVRPSDGEWVTGPMYFYLNYCPITQTKIIAGSNIGDRVEDFPEIWDGVYLWFHYLHQARYGGLYNGFRGGNHAVQIAARGKSKSYTCASLLSRLFICGENSVSNKKTVGVVTAIDKTKLSSDGILNKFISCIDFCADHTQFPSSRLKEGMSDMAWIMGYKDSVTGANKGTENSVYGIAVGADTGKSRGKRANLFIYEEFGAFRGFLTTWDTNKRSVEEGNIVFGQAIAIGCVCGGTKVYNKYGKLINIEDITQESGILGYKDGFVNKEPITYIQDPVYKECVEIQTNNRILRCSIDHPILSRIQKSKRIDNYKISDKRIRWYENKFIKSKDLKVGNYINVIDKVDIWGEDSLFDPRLVGMLIGDGSYGMRRHYDKMEFKTPSFSNCDYELLNYITNNYKYNIEKTAPTKDGRIYKEISISGLIPELKKIGIAGQSKTLKRLPSNFNSLDKQNTCDLLGGLFDTDGCVCVGKTNHSDSITLAQANIGILEEVLILLNKLGIYGKIQETISNSGFSLGHANKYYILSITDSLSILNFYNQINLLVKYKKDNLIKIINKNKKTKFTSTLENTRVEKIVKITNIGKQRVYNLTANDSHTYIANGIITHNTGGEEGNDFSGALELIYHPKGRKVYALPNIYDKNSQGSQNTIFFYSTLLNNKPFYDKDGNSDVIAALLSVLKHRYVLKYDSSDPTAITKAVAEDPITIQEAILKRDSTIYPVSEITDRINELDTNPKSFDDILTGKLAIEDNKVKFKPSYESLPIREFPHKDNKLEGGIEIFQLPKGDSNGNIPRGRYIAGCLLPGEKVNTSEGLKNVENVSLEDTLINIEGEEVSIKNLQRYEVNDEDTYTVKLSNVYNTTTFSSEHPIYSTTPIRRYNGIKKVKNGLPERYYEYNFEFKQVKDLKVGDVVKVPNTYIKEKEFLHEWEEFSRIDRTIENPLLKEDFWWFVGLYLGDGWSNKKGFNISVAFNNKEQEYINKFKNIVTNIFNRNTKSRIRKVSKNCIEYSFCYQYLNYFLTKNFGVSAENKNIPEWVKYIPQNLKKALICGYLASDGCVTNNNINFVSISNKLLADVQDILFSLGIISNQSKLRSAGNHTINNKLCNTRETYELRIGESDSYKIKSWTSSDLKLNKLKIRSLTNHNRKYVFLSEDLKFIYIRVTNIDKKVYSGTIYNFACDTHTYMCNYIPTHNCDPYDDDVSETLSLGSILILDLWTDEIVFEYTGRPKFADDFYEICRRALLFYNAEANYENNKKGLFTYFSKYNCLYLLSDTLEFLKDKEMIKVGYGNKAKGSTSTAPVKSYARTAIRNYLLTPTTIVTTKDGEECEVNISKLFTIRNRALLKELSLWNPEGNFDRHDALGMLMLLREDKLRLLGDTSFEKRNEISKDYLGEDDFFNRNYNSH